MVDFCKSLQHPAQTGLTGGARWPGECLAGHPHASPEPTSSYVPGCVCYPEPAPEAQPASACRMMPCWHKCTRHHAMLMHCMLPGMRSTPAAWIPMRTPWADCLVCKIDMSPFGS